MAIDPKYGRVTLEHGNIGDDEIVVVFRAKDKILPKLLSYYHLFCLKEGSPRRHLDMVLNAKDAVDSWQKLNETKVPDSETSRQWME